MTSNDASSLYVTLDALLDTRLGTLFHIDPERAITALHKPDHAGDTYFTRKYDAFYGYDQAEYEEAYKNRDKAVLKNAVMTQVVLMMKFFVDKTVKASISTPYAKYPKIVINLYPYVLSDVEIALLKHGVNAVLRDTADIETVFMSPKEVTPAYLKQNFASAVMYDYIDWLEVHSESKALANAYCRDLPLIVPSLVRSADSWNASKDQDVFKSIEVYTSIFIKLMIYPVSSFSIDLEHFRNVQSK